MKLLRSLHVSLGLALTGILFAQSRGDKLPQWNCGSLLERDKYTVEDIFCQASGFPGPHGDGDWGLHSRNRFKQPQAVTACVWSTLESCKQLGEGVYQCADRKILRVWLPIAQMKFIQHPCEFVHDAQTVISKSASPWLRARLCLDSVMRGGDLKCLENERHTIADAFRKGSVVHRGYYDGGPRTDRWLYDALYPLPAPIYAPLLPWLQSLPDRSKSPHLIWARKLAIAAHQKDLAGFLALYREADTFFSSYISKWAVYYFPQTDWKEEFSKMHFSQAAIDVEYCSRKTAKCGTARKNRQSFLLESVQGAIDFAKKHPDILANEKKQIEDSFCKANTNLSAPQPPEPVPPT